MTYEQQLKQDPKTGIYYYDDSECSIVEETPEVPAAPTQVLKKSSVKDKKPCNSKSKT